MKFTIVLLACLFAVAAARPGEYDNVQLVRSVSDVNEKGFKFGFETSDGTSHDAEGNLKQVDKEEAIVVHGQFTWKDKNGEVFTVHYVADEYGYQPTGDHLPQNGVNAGGHPSGGRSSHGKHF